MHEHTRHTAASKLGAQQTPETHTACKQGLGTSFVIVMVEMTLHDLFITSSTQENNRWIAIVRHVLDVYLSSRLGTALVIHGHVNTHGHGLMVVLDMMLHLLFMTCATHEIDGWIAIVRSVLNIG